MDNLVMTAKPVRVPRRLNRRVLTIVVCAVIAVLLLAILISGICITDDMVAPNFAQKNQAPSMAHMFGTDWLGHGEGAVFEHCGWLGGVGSECGVGYGDRHCGGDGQQMAGFGSELVH